jgi:hypothetical protein
MRFVKDENENDYAHAGIVALEIQAGCSSPTQESGCYYRSIDMLVGDKQSVSVAPPELELSSQGGDPGDPCVDTGEPTFSAVGAAATFVRDYWIRVSAISAILLVPCFWHRRIEAGDLASHVYDAWLAQLIEQGQAPGLWLAQQWNNIFFNVLLVRLGNLTGLEFAEKICVSLSAHLFGGCILAGWSDYASHSLVPGPMLDDLRLWLDLSYGISELLHLARIRLFRYGHDGG